MTGTAQESNIPVQKADVNKYQHMRVRDAQSMAGRGTLFNSEVQGMSFMDVEKLWEAILST